MNNDLVINQRRLGYSRKFHFADEQLTYTVRDFSGERTFNVPYEALNLKNVSTLRSNNPRFAQMLRMGAIGGLALGVLTRTYDKLAADVLSAVSAVAFAAVWLAQYKGQFSVDFTLIPMKPVPAGANTTQLSIIGNTDHDRILAELTKRSRDRLRFLYGTVNIEGDPEQESQRMKWLKGEGIISDNEYDMQMHRLRAFQQLLEASDQLH